MTSLHEVSVTFGTTTALSGFTGSFAGGTVTALIGGDGAGKSTLLRVLSRRLRVTGTQQIPDQRRVGYQPADAGVWNQLSVIENIEFVAGVQRLRGPSVRDRIDILLQRTGLDQVPDRLAGQLSGGMRQKLGFILATLHQPALVLLDEPTTGVDQMSRAELWALIVSAANDGATVVLATTYLDEAERADQLFLLSDGTLLASGTPAEVIRHCPGQIWRASSATATPDSARTWRREQATYLWTPELQTPGPQTPGPTAVLEPDHPDLENTCIALLLEAEEREGQASALGVLGTEEGSSAGSGAVKRHLDSGPGRDTSGSHPASQWLIQAHDIVRKFGDFTALRGVSLTVAPGEIVGLIGGNGAGKTTLMRILLGLDTPSSGICCLVGGKPSLETRRRIGYVAQGLGLYSGLSASENLQFAAAVHGVTVGTQAARFAEAWGRRPIGELPLGTQRVLAYCCASQHDPDLLILDEPTSGMDPLTRARLWKHLRATAERGVGILVTTHYQQEAAQCDRLITLTAGQVTPP